MAGVVGAAEADGAMFTRAENCERNCADGSMPMRNINNKRLFKTSADDLTCAVWA